MSVLNKMSRLVRIGENMIEISGLHGVWVGPDHLCRSKMTLFYLNRPTVTITYELDKHVAVSYTHLTLPTNREV